MARKFFGPQTLVNGSTIIKLVPICLINRQFFFIFALLLWINKYFISMCFSSLEWFSFLERKKAVKLSMYILSDLAMLLTIPSLEIKFCNDNAWIIASKHHMNSPSIVEVAITYVISYFSMKLLVNHQEYVTECGFPRIHTSHMVWNQIDNYFEVIWPLICEHVILGTLQELPF